MSAVVPPRPRAESWMKAGSSTHMARPRASFFVPKSKRIALEPMSRHREEELEPQPNTVQVSVNVVAPRLAPEEPNVYSHGRQSDDPAPEERNVPAMSKSSNDIKLLTELAEIS